MYRICLKQGRRKHFRFGQAKQKYTLLEVVHEYAVRLPEAAKQSIIRAKRVKILIFSYQEVLSKHLGIQTAGEGAGKKWTVSRIKR